MLGKGGKDLISGQDFDGMDAKGQSAKRKGYKDIVSSALSQALAYGRDGVNSMLLQKYLWRSIKP